MFQLNEIDRFNIESKDVLTNQEIDYNSQDKNKPNYVDDTADPQTAASNGSTLVKTTGQAMTAMS